MILGVIKIGCRSKPIISRLTTAVRKIWQRICPKITKFSRMLLFNLYNIYSKCVWRPFRMVLEIPKVRVRGYVWYAEWLLYIYIRKKR
jgi:hypothetical protein